MLEQPKPKIIDVEDIPGMTAERAARLHEEAKGGSYPTPTSDRFLGASNAHLQPERIQVAAEVDAASIVDAMHKQADEKAISADAEAIVGEAAWQANPDRIEIPPHITASLDQLRAGNEAAEAARRGEATLKPMIDHVPGITHD